MLLRLLLRGASPLAACAQLGVEPETFLDWLQGSRFRARLIRALHLLSQNVAAALYRKAMEGSVAAQTFYLRHLPPPEWPQPAASDDASPLQQLSDDELADLCRAHGIDLSLASVDGGGAAADAPQPG